MEKKKIVHCISAPSLRKLVEAANELNISKEDIINIVDFGNQIHLIYYR